MSQPPFRTRALLAMANLGIGRPWTVLLVTLALVALSATLIPGIQFSTSRYRLVSPDNVYQKRLIRFWDRFGYPDAPVLVVSGGTPPERRRLVDALVRRLQQEADLRGRVLGRVGPEEIAEVLLFHQPALLSMLHERMGPGFDLAELIEGGLPAWFRALTARIERGLESQEPQEDADASLRQFAALLRVFRDEASGAGAKDRLSSFADTERQKRRRGLDEEGYLVGNANRHHVIALFPALPGMEGHQVKPLVDRIRRIRDEVLARDGFAGLTVHVTGMPALVTDELEIVQQGLNQTSLASTVGILAILLFFFRSVRYTILSLVPLGTGVVATLAAVRLIYGELNLLTSSFVSVLLGLGDFGVYLLRRYSEVRHHADGPTAVREAFVHAGPGVVTATVTTSLAYLTTTTTEFTAFAELGVITTVGLVLMVLLTFVLMPPLVSLWGHGTLPPAPEVPGMTLLARVVRRFPKTVIATGTLLTVLGGALGLGIRFNGRYFDFLPTTTESAIGLKQLERDPNTSPIFANLVASSIEEARQMTAALRRLPSVVEVQSPTDLLPPLDEQRLAALRKGFAALGRFPDFERLRNRGTTVSELLPAVSALGDAIDEVAFALRQGGRSTQAADEVKEVLSSLKQVLRGLPDDGREALRLAEADVASILERALTTARNVAQRGSYLPQDLPELFRVRFVSRDGSAVTVYAYPAGDIWQREVSKRFAHDVESVHPEATGTAVSVYQHERMIVEGFLRAAMMALVLVIAVLWIDFHDVKDTALAIIPLIAGWMWMLGSMRVADLTFNVANIVVLPLLLGLGIDAGAQIIHRYRDSIEEHGGKATLSDLICGTGSAILTTYVTTIMGFAALMVADYGAMLSLGLVMTIGLGCCLIASLLVLPAVLVVLDLVE